MAPLYDRDAIKAILPHREPFLFVHEILEMVPGDRVVGTVHVDESKLRNGPVGKDSVSATLLTEAMAQVGAILVLHRDEFRGRTIFFRAIDRARFRRPVPLGAPVRVEGIVRRLRGRLGSLEMKAFLEGTLVAEGVMSFALSD